MHCTFRAERSVKELKEKFLQGKTTDLVKLNKCDFPNGSQGLKSITIDIFLFEILFSICLISSSVMILKLKKSANF